ncbi:hypothetical protein K443DRAFT_14048 [Laccaria amethystina LaAM-08-1]|uniref:HNH nuclease domain-containing protein n=1 Tax=Laccaria amethystina LaAM-08-1 TaxID=1095629 RepID=A0A0C9WHV6_9AGAR|nr:hypothetical protein K443DRAFT_14048 [Laccaria amethystina LaAM-08-1]
MSNRSPTPPRRSQTHALSIDEEGTYTEADLQSDSDPLTPPQRKRHLDDEQYIPDTISGARSDAKGRTPKRWKTASSLPSYVKLNELRHASDKRTVIEFSHVVSGSTTSNEMDHLEWSWKRAFFSLNVNTRKNIQTLNVALHRWFDMTKNNKSVGWFWIPADCDLALLTSMHATYKDPDTFYEESMKFQYRLIPLPNMSESWSVQRYGGDLFGPFDPSLVEHSVYPFNDLPTFELHVPYHSVIVNTGKKLYHFYGMEAIEFDRDFSFLSDPAKNMIDIVRNIYVAWMEARPSLEWLRGKGCDGGQDSPVEQTQCGGVSPHGGRQSSGAASGGKGGKNEAQDAAAAPSGATKGQRRAPTKSLLPWDSASCLEPLELLDEGNGSDDEKPFMDDEDNEYEDDEFFESLKQWASDVWTSTHPDSRSDSEVTLVGAAAGSALSKSVEPTTSPPLALLLSVQ